MYRENQTRRLLVIGLDGATFDVVDPLMEAGKLPNMEKLIRNGVKGKLRSTIPPMSGAAWVSFMTGKNPGKHGVLGFSVLNPNDYGDQSGAFVQSSQYAGRTFFDYIGNNGVKISTYRVPMTYPAWPIKGEMVSGLPTPDRRKAFTYPKAIGDRIGPITLYTNEEINRANEEGEIKDADFQIEVLVRYMKNVIGSGKYGFCMCVTGISDGFQHKFWKYRDSSPECRQEKEGPRKETPVDTAYRKLDDMIGLLIRDLSDDWTVAVISDHGGGPRAKLYFNTNFWLMKNGYLGLQGEIGIKLRKFAKKRMDGFKDPVRRWFRNRLPKSTVRRVKSLRNYASNIDWGKTTAYRVKLYGLTEGIHLNVVGRQKYGVIEPGEEYMRVREEIMNGLRTVTDPLSGRPVIDEVYTREEVYSGPFIEDIPDIVFVMDPNYTGGGEVDSLFSPLPESFLEHFSGDHTMDGIMILSGPEIFKTGHVVEGANLLDMAPTFLHALGLPVPVEMDGKVLAEAFTDSFIMENPVRETSLDLQTAGEVYGGSSLTVEEEEGIKEALRGLGYID